MDPKRRLFRKLGENANWEPVPKGDGLSVEDLVGAGTDRGTLGEVGVLEILRRLNDLRPDSLSGAATKSSTSSATCDGSRGPGDTSCQAQPSYTTCKFGRGSF